MQKIFKYPIPITDEFVIEMPAMHQPLKVGIQASEPVLWAMVNSHTESVNVTFRIFGTGHEIENPDKLQYISTFQLRGLVWHLFKVLDA